MQDNNSIYCTYNNRNEIKEKFPELVFEDSLGHFEFSFASIYGYGNTSNEISKRTNLISDIAQIIFYYQDAKMSIDGNCNLEELYIIISTISENGNSFCFSVKEYKYIINALYSYSVSDISFEVGSNSFYIVYNKSKTEICGLLYQRKINNTICACLITTIKHKWVYSFDEATTVDFIMLIKLNTFLDELYSSLDK